MRLAPIHFHQVHCANTVLSDDGLRASSNAVCADALAFSSRPITVGELVVIRHVQQRPKWSGSLRIGVTTVDPASLRFKDLNKEYSSAAICYRPGYWMATVPRACTSEAGMFKLKVSSIGELHLESLHGHVENPFLVGVDSKHPLWMFIVLEMGKTLVFMNPYACHKNVLIPQPDVRSVATASHALANNESVSMIASPFIPRPSSTPAVVKSNKRNSGARKKKSSKRGRSSSAATRGPFRVIQPAFPHLEAIFNHPPPWYWPTQYSLAHIHMATELDNRVFIELFKLERSIDNRLHMLRSAENADELTASLSLPSNQVPDNYIVRTTAWDETFGGRSGRAGEVARQVEQGQDQRSSVNNEAAVTSASTQLQQLKSNGAFCVQSSRDQLQQRKASLVDESPRRQMVSASRDQTLSLEQLKLREDNSRSKMKSSTAGSAKNLTMTMTTDTHDRVTCIVCKAAPRDTALLDCSHFSMCNNCANEIKEDNGKCPTCNMPIMRMQQLYVS